MNNILVCGHRNPDTDSIVSAISYAAFLNASGQTAEAVALGEPSEETKFALDAFDFTAPRVIEAAQEGDRFALVDHNEAQQSVPDRELATILSVVDHHRIANFETPGPLYYRAEPVGCSNTIIFKMFQEKGFDIDKKLAGLMLSAIVSDTLLMKSPTCTEEDVTALRALADIAEVDLEKYGLDLLKAGTNLSAKSDEELLVMDAKSFPMGDQTVRIAQVNTVDEADVLSRRDGLTDLMEKANKDDGYALFLLLITNILDSNTTALVVGESNKEVEAAFNEPVQNGEISLPGVVSRKKQVVPPLTKAFEG